VVYYLHRKESSEMTQRLTASLQNEGEWTVATCLENGIASQGHTIEEALENLKEALALFFEDEQTLPNYPQVYVTSFEVAV